METLPSPLRHMLKSYRLASYVDLAMRSSDDAAFVGGWDTCLHVTMPDVAASHRRPVRVVVRVRPPSSAEEAASQCCTVLNHVCLRISGSSSNTNTCGVPSKAFVRSGNS